MTYSYAQLEAIAKQGGFPDNMLGVMAAIAMAESGGNPGALNPNDNGGTQSSFGLWQISTGTHTPPDPNWADPVTNARLAYGKYQSQGLGAWGTFTSGAYKSYMQGQVPPDLNIGPPAGGGNGGGGGTAAPAGLTSDILGPILSPLADITNYVIWVGIAAAGLVLTGVGAFLLFKDTSGVSGAVGRYTSTLGRVASAPIRYVK